MQLFPEEPKWSDVFYTFINKYFGVTIQNETITQLDRIYTIQKCDDTDREKFCSNYEGKTSSEYFLFYAGRQYEYIFRTKRR
ncbi:MAG: hypothetical protein ACI9CD_000224 [Candidatus Deianiraeaceae bacterium]|jgi:hypothetical protein